MRTTADALFLETGLKSSSVTLPSVIFRCVRLPILLGVVYNTKGNLTFRKIENMQPWHFVYFVDRKLNPLNLINLSVFSEAPQIHALKVSVS